MSITWEARVSLPAASAAISVTVVLPSGITGVSENWPAVSAVVTTSPSCHEAVMVAPGSETPSITALSVHFATVVAVKAGAVASVENVHW